MNGAGAPLCSEVVSRAQCDLLLLPGWGIVGGWPAANFYSTHAYTKFLKGKGQANKPYQLSQSLRTGHLLISCQLKCRILFSCLEAGGEGETKVGRESVGP